VTFGIDRLDRRAIAENISEGGLYLNTNEVAKPGTKLILRIEFPEGAVSLRGDVVWAIQVPEHERERFMCGMGIRFLEPSPEWEAVFQRWKSVVKTSSRAAGNGGRP
jgi:Tfp pilus assembly protein PilZ